MRRYFVFDNSYNKGAIRMDLIAGWRWEDAAVATMVHVRTIDGISYQLTQPEFNAMLALADSDWWLLDLGRPPASGSIQ